MTFSKEFEHVNYFHLNEHTSWVQLGKYPFNHASLLLAPTVMPIWPLGCITSPGQIDKSYLDFADSEAGKFT